MRKVIQITAVASSTLYMLCDDGTVWQRYFVNGVWVCEQIEEVPHDLNFKCVEVGNTYSEYECPKCKHRTVIAMEDMSTTIKCTLCDYEGKSDNG